jgi:hypothetical protein
VTDSEIYYSVKSIDITSCYILQKSEFMKVLQLFPEDLQTFCKIKDDLLFNESYTPRSDQQEAEEQNKMIPQDAIRHSISHSAVISDRKSGRTPGNHTNSGIGMAGKQE